MKNIIIVLSLFISLNLHAQCTIKIDKFKKDTSISSPITKIGKNKEGFSKPIESQIKQFKHNDNSYIVLCLVPHFISIQTIKSGETCFIELENGQIIEVVQFVDSISDYTKIGSNIVWYNFLQFMLSDENTELLLNNNIKSIKCSISEFEISNKTYIKNSLKCVIDKSKSL